MATADLCARSILSATSKEENFQLLQLITETAKEVKHYFIDASTRYSVVTFNDGSKIKLSIKDNLIISFVILAN